MQRIDENTYVDDSLITCAEYQLFIDEMRKQGKYYQPDHWTSYHYPAEQARKPILGIRQSDAVAFCEWLTQRENGEWQYRLPFKAETIHNPINCVQLHAPIGNWILTSNIQYQFGLFVWIKPLFVYPDKLPLDPGVFLDRVRNYVTDINFLLLRTEMQKILAEPKVAQFFSKSRFLDIEREIDRVLTDRLLTNYFAHTRLGENGPSQVKELLEIFQTAFARNIEHERDLDRCLVRVINLAHELDRDFDKIFRHVLRFNGRRAFSRERDLDLAIQLARALDIYINIIAIQERIAGRSPAFEGIRLVKERK